MKFDYLLDIYTIHETADSLLTNTFKMITLYSLKSPTSVISIKKISNKCCINTDRY